MPRFAIGLTVRSDDPNKDHIPLTEDLKESIWSTMRHLLNREPTADQAKRVFQSLKIDRRVNDDGVESVVLTFDM